MERGGELDEEVIVVDDEEGVVHGLEELVHYEAVPDQGPQQPD